MQNAYDHVNETEWSAMLPQFKFVVGRAGRYADFNENYLGLGILYGVTDYHNWTVKTDEEILAVVPLAGKPCQIGALLKNWGHRDAGADLTVPTTLVITVRQDGYSVRTYWGA